MPPPESPFTVPPAARATVAPGDTATPSAVPADVAANSPSAATSDERALRQLRLERARARLGERAVRVQRAAPGGDAVRGRHGEHGLWRERARTGDGIDRHLGRQPRERQRLLRPVGHPHVDVEFGSGLLIVQPREYPVRTRREVEHRAV